MRPYEAQLQKSALLKGLIFSRVELRDLYLFRLHPVFRTSEYSMCQPEQKPRRPAEVLSLGVFYAKSFNGRVSHHEHGALHGFHPAYTMDRLSRASLFGLDL